MKPIDTPYSSALFNLRESLRTDLPAGAVGHPVSVATAHQSLARQIREYLDRKGFFDWKIFQTFYGVLDDDAMHLVAGLYGVSQWEPLGGAVGLSTTPLVSERRSISDGTDSPWTVDEFGVLLIPQAQVMIGRGHYTDPHGGSIRPTFIASPSISVIHEFQRQIGRMAWRKRREDRRWAVCYGAHSQDEGTLIEAGPGFSDLDISDALMTTIQRELVGFFQDEVRRLHKNLKLPYARRTLLYGPPGTGKTSICRAVARACPGVAAFHLMPSSDFDDEDLKFIFDAFCAQAPAILLIEDLDTLVGEGGIKVSNFLNMLDGANSPRGEGLLVLATTNYPDRLPPSLANRPGRFVPLEVPLPDAVLRARFITRSFSGLAPDLIQTMVRRTDGLSFAHLNELLLVAGLIALKDGRAERTGGDIDLAIDHIQQNHHEASGGFLPKPSGKFGFAAAGGD